MVYRVIITCIFATALAAGVLGVEVRGDEPIRTADAGAKRIAVLATSGTSEDIRSCVAGTLADARPVFDIVPSNEFRTSLYPWFEPGTVPETADELAALMRKPLVSARIEELDVGHVVVVSGGTQVQGSFSELGYSGFAASWKKRSQITAGILDLKELRRTGNVESSKSGTAWFVYFVFPFGAPAPTETTACSEVGERLVRALSGQATNKRNEADAQQSETPPLCRDVGGYEAYMKRTGEVCRLD